MRLPTDRKYAATHEWILPEGDSYLVGITDHAQEALGDVVFVGEVKVGQTLAAGDLAGIVESVKAASDFHAPIAGTITAFNDALQADPAQLNSDPYGTWIYRLQPAAGASPEGLLDAEAYRASVG